MKKLNKDAILKEILACGKNPTYFTNNYCKISHPIHGVIPFRTYPFQDQLLKDFNDHRFNIVLKARQLGISTIAAAYVAWLLTFHRDKNVLVVATKRETAANLIIKVKKIIKNLPPWLRISDVVTDNNHTLAFSNGSKIKAESTSSDAGRSEALSLLILDEAAHIENLGGPRGLWTGLSPTLATGGRCIAISTPNGTGNWFYGMYTGAENGSNSFYPTKLMWDVIPERDEEWYESETKNLDARQIAQELCCNFNASGDTVIAPGDLENIKNYLESINPRTGTLFSEPLYKAGFDRNYWIFEKFDKKCTYLMAADVARGDGNDNSAFHILNLNTGLVDAEYQGKLKPDAFAELIYNAGGEYGSCLVAVENNTVGYMVLEKLKDRGYPSIYYSKKSTHEFVNEYEVDTNSNSIVPGFTMSSKTRPLVVAKMEEVIRNGTIMSRSNRLFAELKTFVWNNGRGEAQREANDDLVMCFAILCWVKETAIEGNLRDTEMSKAVLDTMFSTNKTLDTSMAASRGFIVSQDFTRGGASEQAKWQKKFSWLFRG